MTREEAIKEVKLLINNVIDYNEQNGTHIFFDSAPHCNFITFFYYNDDKKWHDYEENEDGNRCIVHYDVNSNEESIVFFRKVNEVKSWLS